MLKKPKRPPKPKQKRRARGTGSIFPDKRRGGWKGKVPVGRYLNGRTKYTEVSAPTQAGVVEAMKLVAPPGPGTTVSQWADRWLADTDVRASSRDDYRHTVEKYIKPTLGHLRVTDVTAADVERACRKWKETLGANTLKKDLTHLSGLFTAARRAGLVAVNPVSAAKKPKAEPVESRPLPPQDLARVIAGAVAAGGLEGPYAVLAATGCRVGELVALDVPDFDPESGTIAITKTYTKKHGMRPPKTANGRRTIRVPAPALPALRAAAGERRSGPLFRAHDGKRRYHSSLQRRWGQFLDGLALARRGMHQLRHSVATALVADGVPIADVARYLGDTVHTIVTRYLHATGVDPADALERLYGGRKVAEGKGDASKRLENKARGRRRDNT